MTSIRQGERRKLFKILTQPNGTFLDIRFDKSIATEAVEDISREQIGYLISIYGPNRFDEAQSIISEASMDFVSVTLPGTRGQSNLNTIPRTEILNKTLSNVARRYSQNLFNLARPILDSSSSFNIEKFNGSEFIKTYGLEIGAKSQLNSSIFIAYYEYIEYIETILGRFSLIHSFNEFSPMDQLLPLAVWVSKPRKYPLILLTPMPLEEPKLIAFRQFESQNLVTLDVLKQIGDSLNLSENEVNTAFKVWSLSRRASRQTGSARAAITMPAARELCAVVSETYSEKIISQRKPKQHAAPIKFRLSDGGLTVLTDKHPGDSETVVRAAASALLNRAEGLVQRGALANQLPTFPESMERVRAILVHMCGDNYDDGHIVSLGLEFNALQWEVNATKSELSTGAIAEVTGLFANAHLFLDRFPIWKSYTSRGEVTDQDAFATFKLARNLLEDAKKADNLLAMEAQGRVESVLQRAPNTTVAPPLVDGVIASGENLGAAVVATVSDLLLEEGREFKKEIRSEARKGVAKTIVKFSADRASDIGRLLLRNENVWGSWISDRIDDIVAMLEESDF